MRFGQWLGVLAFILSVYILWQINQIVLLVFGAVVLATVLNRVVQLLQRTRMQRGIAVALTIIFLLLLIVGFFAVVFPPIFAQGQKLVYLLPQSLQRVRLWFEWIQTVVPQQLVDNIRNLQGFTQNLQTWTTRLFGNFFAFFNNSLGIVLNFLLFLVVTIMFLVNPVPYRRVFVLAFPAFYRRRVEEILSECERSLVGWIKGTLFDMLVIAVVSYIGLLILQVPLPLVNALLAGLLEFIPNVGPTLSLIPPALLAFLDAPWKAVAVIILYVVIQQFESLVLVPMVMKQQVSLLPVFTILSVVIFSSFFGFLGLFLAIPLLIVVQIWLKEALVKDILNQWQPKEEQGSRGAEEQGSRGAEEVI
ncbi:AI-2E family transporter [Phormidium sp. LEGE 05292]|uniref:AI-2E family transporter n=1 Tax=[Phormidium] sp. LEGE 05292 TaxID=767427 RepID=UPI00187F8000|nr:AI-2E family transporter [Phormidium sp. LEGE 05292]MBE9225356.1 AI-2E family transporter [Phormidium sp. LEGE 05292]